MPENPLHPGVEPSLLPPPPPPLSPERVPATHPASVMVLAVLFLLAALLELTGFTRDKSTSDSMFYIFLADSAVFFCAKTVVGIGLLRMVPWARVAAMYTLIARFIFGNFLVWLMYFTPGGQAYLRAQAIPTWVTVGVLVVSTIGSIIYYTIAIIILTRPGIKAAFARQQA